MERYEEEVRNGKGESNGSERGRKEQKGKKNRLKGEKISETLTLKHTKLLSPINR